MKKWIIILTLTFLSVCTVASAQASLFKDVPLNKQFSYFIYDVVGKGIMRGYKDNTFKPDNYVTRAELAYTVSKTLQYENKQIAVNRTDTYDDQVMKAINKVAPSVTQIINLPGLSTGTGFVISNNKIITNAHVVENCDSPLIGLNNDTAVVGKVIKKDLVNDLALIEFDNSDKVPSLKINTNVKVGQTAIAFGNPFDLTNVASRGIISSLQNSKWIQVDTAINPGNSGSPLFNLNGEVIGVVVAKYVGDNVDNIGFTIKGSILANFLK
jgi:S1-C subfamily serine protease